MILAIIPARGGSKGIPKKNIKPLLGKPLVVWSVEAALDSKLIDEIIVSTDSKEIADAIAGMGVNADERPPHLATDTATTLDVLRYHINDFPDADTIVLLQPTSPVRHNRIIDTALRRFRIVDCDTMASGYMSTHVAWGKAPHGPRQKQTAYFHDDGCIYIFKRSVIESGRWIGDHPHELIIDPEYNIEIDSIADFWAVEGIMRHVYPSLAR